MKAKSIIYIVLASLLWGSSGIFVHFLAPVGFSSLQMTAVRSIVSALSMLIYIVIRDKKLLKVRKRDLLLLAGAGLSYFCTASAYYAAMQASSVSTAVILMYTAPVFVMAYSVAFMGEKLTKRKTVSVVVMLLGCALVSGVIGGMKFSVLGILLGLFSGISYSAYNVFAKVEMDRGTNPLSATFWCFLIASVAALCVSNPPQMIATAMQAPLWVPFVLLGLGIFTCVTPYFLYSLALRDLPAGTASALGIIEPMAATVYSVLFLGEVLGIASVGGIVLILGAVFLLSRNVE
ncbi:MAG: EamA family transporter [Clostridia bacterium]|nr:EamA family transporter [Clostridia bacterium]